MISLFRSPFRGGWVSLTRAAWVVLLIGVASCVTAEETPPVPAATQLADRQAGVAQRYQRLEELLLRLAEVEAAENPERAGLLRRAAKQSRDKFVLEKLRTASQSLQNEEFEKAVKNQGTAKRQLGALLELLMSEDRGKRIRDEKQRFTKLMKELKRTLNGQRSTRARTENGADFDQLRQEQADVTDRSEELNKRLKAENGDDSDPQKSDAAENSDSSAEENDKPSPDGQSQTSPEEDAKESPEPSSEAPPTDDSSPNQNPADPTQKSDSESSDPQPSGDQPAESQPSESQPGQPNSRQPSESQPPSDQGQSDQDQSDQDQPSSSPQTPEQQVQQQLEQAIEKMKQAEREIEESKRQEASEQQRQAEERLRAAIDQLERILRQLREEELQRQLAKLESRLRKMAQMQTLVNEKTVALAATPKTQRDRTTDVKAGDLAFEEKKIMLEADRAMLLLREEGSSVAFPEVIAQIRSDTIRVADRLGRAKIDQVTQGIEQDILTALEEMIAALQKAQRDLEKKQQQRDQEGQAGQPGQGEQPLVEEIAELKLLRTMETRIKNTTQRYSTLLESGESTTDEVLPLLQDLAERQNRLYQIARDLVTKRNQ